MTTATNNRSKTFLERLNTKKGSLFRVSSNYHVPDLSDKICLLFELIDAGKTSFPDSLTGMIIFVDGRLKKQWFYPHEIAFL